MELLAPNALYISLCPHLDRHSYAFKHLQDTSRNADLERENIYLLRECRFSGKGAKMYVLNVMHVQYVLYVLYVVHERRSK